MLAASVALGATILSATPSRGAAGGTQPPQLLPVLAPGGPSLTDTAGRLVELHGVDLLPKCGVHTSGNPCLPDATATQPAYYLRADATDPARRLDDNDARALQDLGIDTVRLGVFWEGIEPGPPNAAADDPTYCAAHAAGTPFTPLPATAEPWDGTVAARYLDHVAATVHVLAAHGIRTILAMYQDVWGAVFANPNGSPPWKGDGAPAWATCTGGAPFLAPASWNAGYTTVPVATSFQHFFLNDVVADLQGQYIRSAVALAKRFRRDPAVIGYGVFNDPSEAIGSLVPGVFDRELQCFLAGTQYAPMSCRAAGQSQAPAVGVIPAVQAADPDHLVFFQPPLLTDLGYPETVGVVEKLPFPNLVLDIHDYSPGILLSPDGSCPTDCSAAETTALREAESERDQTQTAQSNGPALFIGEWGAQSDPSRLEPLAAAADTAGLSWAYYMGKQLDDPTGTTGEALLDDAGVPRANAGAVARVYASAVAGTNVAQSYDPATRHYTLSFTPAAHATAPTEVIVPPWVYKSGYMATVTGATVRSSCGDRTLVLAATPGAGTVTVDIATGTCPAAAASESAAAPTPSPPSTASAVLPYSATRPATGAGLPDTAPSPQAAPGFPAAAALLVLLRSRRRRRPRPENRACG